MLARTRNAVMHALNGNTAPTPAPPAPSTTTRPPKKSRRLRESETITEWKVSRQSEKGKRPTCPRCQLTIEEKDIKCKPATQANGRQIHWTCLPTRTAIRDMVFTAIDGYTTQELNALKEKTGPQLPICVDDPDGDDLEEVMMDAHEEAKETQDPEGMLRDTAWWENRDWVPTDLPPQGTAVQIPKRLQSAWCEVKNHVIEAIFAREAPGNSEALAEWKALLQIDQLMLQAPGERHRQEGMHNVADVLERRIRWFWQGEWALILKDATPEQSLTRKISPASLDEKRTRNKIKRIHTLVMSGEKGRALASLATQGERPTGKETLKKLRELFPKNSDPTPDPIVPNVDMGPIAETAGAAAVKALRSPSKLSAPGLLGGRAEHWQPLARDESANKNLARLLGRIAVGSVPAQVTKALRVCEVAALPKGGNDVRPILLSSVLRRYALKGFMRSIKDKIGQAVGPAQFGVGSAGGAEGAVFTIKVAMALAAQSVAISIDTKAAFQSVRCKEAVQAAAVVPEYAHVLHHWYGEPTEHLWKDEESRWHTIPAESGLDQGCILAAAGFSIATRKQCQ